ncbi:hypothetical protein [Fluviicola taffensis]|uniref:Uncharacterized protein n=1 Tax=Fluviicola taffensis (strain DSM 16823 / NCIMB 13979 / RW262) TaxID=755732 RepID=F2IC30_FLUTR|nr:hypothetical protein [Fluviicola taffensis]AEA43256.1 hypothetical protein Fluta_1261 [Fluviicola taffensis DSM 16823]
MKKLIHTDNYESFYLDYLEGTLSEAERIAFEEFLAAHPELQVDEELLILDDAPELLGALEKEMLKKEEDRFVTSENLDYFAIGKMESILSNSEEKQLDSYLVQNPNAQKVIRDFEETRLEAITVSYSDKESLKQKEMVFIPWKIIAGITGVAALLLLFFQIQTGTGNSTTNRVAQKQPVIKNPKTEVKKSVEIVPSTKPMEEQNSFVAQKDKNNLAPNLDQRRNTTQEENKNEERNLPIEPEVDKNLIGNNKPQPHHPTILPEVKDNKQPVSPTLNEEVKKAPSNDLASNAGHSSNMKNPIPLITNALSENTKTPVDFKTGKATETEKGGFFIKIGKFEIMHKSSKRK